MAADSTQGREFQLAFWNALKLGGSLVGTWTVALAVRFVLPRQLGPEQYGIYSFGAAFAATVFVLTALGTETYVQKEVAVRPSHASDFMGGVLATRAALALGLFGVVAVVLRLSGRPAEVRHIVYLFAAGQILLVCNSTFSALLHARGTVDELATANVAAKLLWGALTLTALVTRSGLVAIAAAFPVAEALKACALVALCRKHLALVLRFDLQATRRVLVTSLPFLVTTLATTLFTRVDDTLLGFLANDREVGWFGLASNLTQVGEVLAPLIGAVLLPLFSRVAARSDAELRETMRRSLELIIVLAVSIAIALALGADVWIRVLGGPEYGPSIRPVRILAPLFVLTYAGMACADYLYLSGRSWTVTAICLGGLGLNAGLNAALIRPMLAALGPGGAGVGSALATVATETFTCAMFVATIGRSVIDRRLLSTVGKLLAACAAALTVDLCCSRLGAARLLLDAAVYCGVALVTGAVRLEEIRTFASRIHSPARAN